ncbi:MAG: HyaD/HybD family hydrogenase maturation endopeptidase [Deltaproteobacteria bacterium]|nr:HyaD/HybD family hydrogenase maturation endopeptidase [Deltaproteobacteria bacterium]
MKTVVLGIGNILLTDEGVGVHAVKELLKEKIPENVEILDGGTLGFGLLDVICEADRLIIIDAIKGGEKPGTVYHFKIDDFCKLPASFGNSAHEITILDVLRAAELLGKSPKIEIFGIEPRSLEIGLELSPDVKENLPKLLCAVLKSLNRIERDQF